MRYTSLEELTDAYARGDIIAPMMLDNDWMGVYQNGETVFELHPEEFRERVLELLGIPWERV